MWITPYANGHLQAVGTDDAGRRQYLYHPHWRASRDAAKFERIIVFGKAISKARERILIELGTEGMALERACAVAVRLLDLGCFRIGNDVYTDTNGSFGLTTLRKEHVTKRGGTLRFDFVGKSGIEHSIEIDDVAVIEALDVMRRRRGGEELLAWKDGRQWRRLDASLVNDYIGTLTGVGATAKDFRTWHATVLAAASLAETDEPGDTKASRKRAEVAAMKEVSEFLGNTPPSPGRRTSTRASWRPTSAARPSRSAVATTPTTRGRPPWSGPCCACSARGEGPQRWSTTQSIDVVSFCTSLGSIAGYIAMRSWLRPSLR